LVLDASITQKYKHGKKFFIPLPYSFFTRVSALLYAQGPGWHNPTQLLRGKGYYQTRELPTNSTSKREHIKKRFNNPTQLKDTKQENCKRIAHFKNSFNMAQGGQQKSEKQRDMDGRERRTRQRKPPILQREPERMAIKKLL